MSATRPGGRVHPAERLLDRELSWLDFNARVLELAADASLPLLERVRFCAIFSSNLDEFFQVRVAGLLDQVASGASVRSPGGRTPGATLADVRRRVAELTQRQSRLWSSELRPALAAEGILVAPVDECTDAERDELARRFDEHVYPILTPLGVGPGQPFPYISALSLSVLVFVVDPDTGEERLARVKVPEGLPRFVPVGDRGVLVPLEQAIAFHLPRLFPGMQIAERAFFRVTRDADFEVSDEADDLLEAVELELQRRRFGEVVRVEVSARASDRMRARLLQGLRAEPDQVYAVEGLVDLADLAELVALDRPELKTEPWAGVAHPRLAEPRTAAGLFAAIAAGDLLVQHPYESFATSVGQFVRASRDPDVIAVKTTVYRTSDESPLVGNLIEAAEDGKQSVCVVELKARFDERRNIEWSRALERAGVHVVHGFPSRKVHAKTTLIVRREHGRLRRYAHIGTGNYHAVTARLYEDFGLFTADPEVTADVADFFNLVTGFGKPEFRRILVAPFGLREGLIERIRAVAAAAEAGLAPARVRIKVNNLTDGAVVDELYAASRAGAEVELVVRSICALRPGVPGLSDRIRVRSILGRFLEHSRAFGFEAGGDASWLIGSADLMPRNLDHRLEMVVPVTDAACRERLEDAFAALLADPTAWTLGPDGRWARAGRGLSSAQEALMRAARSR